MVYVATINTTMRQLKVLHEVLTHGPDTWFTNGKDIDALTQLQKEVEKEFNRWKAYNVDFDNQDES